MVIRRVLLNMVTLFMVVALPMPSVSQAMNLAPNPAIDGPATDAGDSTPDDAAAPISAVGDRGHAGSSSRAGSTSGRQAIAQRKTDDASSSGRLLFAPDIDADGDPSTNPTAARPVPVIRLPQSTHGMITLAVQLMPADAGSRSLGARVTFHVWRDGVALLTRLVKADAWGAATLSTPFPQVNGDYAYQADAPGYGQTEVRHFRFDALNAGLTVHAGGAELQPRILEDGRVEVTLTSPAPLVADRDEATVIILRRAQNAPVATSETAQQALSSLSGANVWLPLPPLPMSIVDGQPARLVLQLPPGEYQFSASLTVNLPQTQQYLAQPVVRVLEKTFSAETLTDPVWVAAEQHEKDNILVQYAAPAGQAVFALVAAAQAAAITPRWDAGSVMLRAWRIGPYQWQEEAYRVQTAPGRIEANLKSFDYDPIARSYSIALRPRDAETMTVQLRADILGPGGVILRSVDWTASLAPGRESQQSIQSPAELGRPEGLQVTILDQAGFSASPLLIARRTASAHFVRLPQSPASGSNDSWPVITDLLNIAANAMRGDQKADGQDYEAGFSYIFNGSIKFSLSVLSTEIAALTWTYKPGSWGSTPPSWGTIVQQILEGALYNWWNDNKVVLAGGTVTAALDFAVTYTAPRGNCRSPDWESKVTDRLKEVADSMDNRLVDLGIKAKDANGQPTDEKRGVLKWEYPPIPIIIAILGWAIGRASILDAHADSGGLTISFGVRPNASLTLAAGWELPTNIFDLKEAFKALKLILGTIVLVVDVVVAFLMIRQGPIGGKCGKSGNDMNLGNFQLPDEKPADDRQDVWQNAGALSQGDSEQATIDNLHGLADQAHAQGLSRAEKYFTLRLREHELTRYADDTSGYMYYMQQLTDIEQGYYDDLHAILSGTVALAPGQTISDAIISRSQQAADASATITYVVQLQTLTDEKDMALQQYQALNGQELELQNELAQVFTTHRIGILANGFTGGAVTAMQQAGVPWQMLTLWPGISQYQGEEVLYLAPDQAPRAIVIPTGGMHDIAPSPEARAWLETYVSGGGRLIVFTQMTGQDWQALPGGQVRGVGYDEDQRCEHDSVQAVMPSNWLNWMADPTPDVQVDGAFTAWPREADILLLRTSSTYAGYPAMIEYAYGAGHVLATTAYGDWAVHSAIWWGDDWQMTRSILIRAYLLIQGKDIGDLQSVAPDTDFTVTFPFTNTSVFAVQTATLTLPGIFSHAPNLRGAAVVTPELPGGASIVISATLHTAELLRHVHRWTQAGLFPIRVDAHAGGGDSYTTWGPFIRDTPPYTPPLISLALAPERPTARMFETLPITATVRNNDTVSKTVVLRGMRDLPATPVTLTVAAGVSATRVYTLFMDASRSPKLQMTDFPTRVLGTAGLTVYIAQPNLIITPRLTAIASGAHFSLQIYNKPNEWQPAGPVLSGTLQVTLTAPNSTTVWSGSAPFSMNQGDVIDVDYTFGNLEPILLGNYVLSYSASEAGQALAQGQIAAAPHIDVIDVFNPGAHRSGQVVTFTAVVQNEGYIGLTPTVTITVPDAGITSTRSITLPAGAQSSVVVSFTVPDLPLDNTNLVRVFAGQGAISVTRDFRFLLQPADFNFSAAPGPYQAGQAVTLTLLNTGGSGATVSLAGRLSDGTGVVAATMSDAFPVLVGQTVTRLFSLPAPLISGSYWLYVLAEDQRTHLMWQEAQSIVVTGTEGALTARTTQPSYISGDAVGITGAVTLTRGALSGTLDLNIYSYGADTVTVGLQEQVNTTDTVPGWSNQVKPDIAVDPAGNAYAVWQDSRPPDPFLALNGFDLYFASRPAGGAWGANERLPYSISNTFAISPSIAVDAAGNATVAWVGANVLLANQHIFFTTRSVTGTWGSVAQLDDSPTPLTNTARVDLAADAAGNVTAVWEDNRSGNLDIRAARRAAGGAWGASVVVNDDGGSALQRTPSLAVDGAGNAYAVWQDQRLSASDDIYFSLWFYTSTTWSPNVEVNLEGGAFLDAEPAIAVDGAGNAYSVWRDNRASTINVYTASRPATTTLSGNWSASVKLNTTANTVLPQIGVDAAGNLHALWRLSTATPQIRAAYKPYTSSTWVADVRVDTASARDRNEPALGVDPAGNALAVWRDNRNGLGDIYFSTRSLTSTWSANSIVEDYLGPVPQDKASLAMDAGGNLYSAWTDGRNGTQPTPNNDIYAATRPVTGSWGSEVKVSDSTGANDQTNPRIAADAAGNLYAVWADSRNSGDVYFATQPISGAWSASVLVNDNTTSSQYEPRIAVDRWGNAHAVWTDLRSGTAEVYYAYRPAGGSWSANEKISTALNHLLAQHPDIAVDGDGNAYAIMRERTYPASQYYEDVYFAFKPAGGSWGTNLKVSVNNTESGTNKPYPRIAVDGFGNAYVVYYGGCGAPGLCFASLPAHSYLWSQPRPISDNPGVNDYAIAADAGGNVYVASAGSGIYLSARSSRGVWVPTVKALPTTNSSPDIVVDSSHNVYLVTTLTPDTAAAGDIAYTTAHVYFNSDSPVWSLSLPENLTAPATQAISQTAGTLGGQPGKYLLTATLHNALSQTAASAQYPFYIYPPGLALTLDTSAAYVQSGKPFTVSGWVTNTSGSAANVPLTVTANYAIVLSQTLALGAGGGARYTVTLAPVASQFIQVFAGANVISQAVAGAIAPLVTQGIGRVDAPAVAGYRPFSATLILTNTTPITANLTFGIGNSSPQPLVIPPGQVANIVQSVSLTHTQSVYGWTRGDWTMDIYQPVTWGEGAGLSLLAPSPALSGAVPITWVLSGAGQLATAVELDLQVDGATAVTLAQTLQPGQVMTGSSALTVAQGLHTLTGLVVDSARQVIVSQTLALVVDDPSRPAESSLQVLGIRVAPPGALLLAPVAAAAITPSSTFTIGVDLLNNGPSAPTIIAVVGLDTPRQWIITPTAYATQSVYLPLFVPGDLPGGTYTPRLIVGDYVVPFTVTVTGVNLGMRLRLSQPYYMSGQTVSLTVVLTDLAATSGSYHLSLDYLEPLAYVTVTVPANKVVTTTFLFTATESGRASVALDRLALAGENGERTLTIDSLPVAVVDPASEVYVTFNKSIYAPGETITMTVPITGHQLGVMLLGPTELALGVDNLLMWMAPLSTSNEITPGLYVVTYTLPPALPSRRYTFDLSQNGAATPYQIDVKGMDVTTGRFTLDRPRYNPGDVIQGSVEFYNAGATPITNLLMSALVALPDAQDVLALSPPISQMVTLQPGLNVFTISGALSTTVPGPHRIVVNLGLPGELWRVAGSATQFDVGQAHLVDLTTDHGSYAPAQPGVGTLSVYGVGQTQLLVTATGGLTVFSTTVNLGGLQAYTFTIPTAAQGDYVLSARAIDAAHNTDRLLRAYNVPAPPDLQAPVITLTWPSTYTLIATSAATMTLIVSGAATDDRALKTVLVNGVPVSVTSGGLFTAALVASQGVNTILATGLDAVNNVGYSPAAQVVLQPAHRLTLSADTAGVRIVLTATGSMSEVQVTADLLTGLLTDVHVYAGSGIGAVSAISPTGFHATWFGDVTASQPVTITVNGQAVATGTFTSTAIAYWGLGYQTRLEVATSVTTYGKHVYLPVVRR